jgi:creatinine amidohydrolase/Fe(II)-dependent formamide hydrolase-like protein
MESAMPLPYCSIRASRLTQRRCLGIAWLLLACSTSTALAQSRSVFLEELTWPELQQRVAAGATTAIVPKGGTEQNGPHMALGKHNFVVREAARRIATRLGNALVAPVLPVVPEGSPDQPNGNLRFPGTLALGEETFERTLRDIAASLARSGFKLILFLGDHGQSLPVQEKIADSLSNKWAGRGIRAMNVSAYYSPEAQDAQLVRDGVPKAELGDHAGIADTAQLLAVKPEAVRTKLAVPERWKGLPASGATGRPDRATAEMGKKLLGQRVKDALAQIRSIEQARR